MLFRSVIAARRNREVDGVIDQLRRHGLSVERFATCQYPEHEFLTWNSFPCIDRKRDVPKAGWLCDLSGWSFEDRLEGLEREIAASESTAFVEGSLLALECPWLNSVQVVRTASRKLFQLNVAQRLGLSQPETCVTNSPSDARKFCLLYPRVVAKTLSTSYVLYGQKRFKFYTRRIGQMGDDVFKNLRFGPMVFQVEIEKAEELRVTVVDNETFAVRLELSKIDKDEVDIRRLDYAQHQASFSACKDRPDLLEASLKITQALGLSYAGIDWAVDKFGGAYFLECNPLGAFKWFEICGGHDITGARLACSGGLHLEVSPAGSKRWFWKYHKDGKEGRMSLGSYPDVGPKDARKVRDAVKLQKSQEADPVMVRKVEKLKASRTDGDTFKTVALEWYAK